MVARWAISSPECIQAATTTSQRIDTTLIFLNLLLLALIVFIPVPTALLAEYLTRPDTHAAIVLYSGACVLMSCGYNLLWRYASYHHRLLGSTVDLETVDAINKQYLFGPICYLIALLVGLISSPVAIGLVFVLALFFTLPSRTVRPRTLRQTPAMPVEREEKEG